jgi:hypothetical protein
MSTLHTDEIRRRVLAEIPRTVELVYVDYRSEFTDEQLQMLRAGELDDIDEELWDVCMDERAEGTTHHLAEAVASARRRLEREVDGADEDTETGAALAALLDEFPEDDDDLDWELADVLRDTIADRDSSDTLADLARHSRLAVGVWLLPEDERDDIDVDPECWVDGYFQGSPAVLFQVDAGEVLKLWRAHRRGESVALKVTGAVWAGRFDSYNGAGWLNMTDTVTVTVTPEMLADGWLERVHGFGYTWDECAGPVWETARAEVVTGPAPVWRPLLTALVGDGVEPVDALQTAMALGAAESLWASAAA